MLRPQERGGAGRTTIRATGTRIGGRQLRPASAARAALRKLICEPAPQYPKVRTKKSCSLSCTRRRELATARLARQCPNLRRPRRKPSANSFGLDAQAWWRGLASPERSRSPRSSRAERHHHTGTEEGTPQTTCDAARRDVF